MTDYLIRLGHRKIAVLAAGKEDVSIGRMRLMGYLRALREQGIEPDEGLICYMNPKLPSYSMENGYVLTRQLLDEGKEFTAVFAFQIRWQWEPVGRSQRRGNGSHRIILLRALTELSCAAITIRP